MNSRDPAPGWLGQRSVAFWTVVAGIAAAITLAITIISLASGSSTAASPPQASASEPPGSPSSSSPPGPTSTQVSQPVTYFLDSQASDSFDNSAHEIPYFNGFVEPASPQEVNGQQFARNLNFGFTCSDTSSKFADYNLGRHFDTFSTTLGLSDISKSAGYQFEIWKDGRRVYVATLHRGQSRRIKMSVKGILSLRLGSCSVDDSVIMEESGGGIFGDPQVTGRARNIPNPAPS